MGQFNSMCLTKKGLRLQAKAQTGEKLAFSRAAAGCGYLPDNTDVLELTSLIEPIDTPVDITGNQVIGDGTTQLSVRVQNGSTAFYFREIGIFATDPDEGEILYAYSNAGDYADFMPKLRGTDRVITDVTIITQIGNAENIDVNVTLIPEVLHDEFNAHRENAVIDHPDGSVTTEKIANGAVTAEKLAIGAVDVNNLAAGLTLPTYIFDEDSILEAGLYILGNYGQCGFIIMNTYDETGENTDGDYIMANATQLKIDDSGIRKRTAREEDKSVTDVESWTWGAWETLQQS